MAEPENELETEIQTGVNEQDIFKEASSDTPEVPAELEPQLEDKPATERSRDETGKFTSTKAKPEEAEPEAAAQADKTEQRGIPSARLKEEADKRRTAEARADELSNRLALLERQALQQPQHRPQPQEPAKQKELPDPLLDPDGFKRAVFDEVRTELRINGFNNSMLQAERAHKDVFQQAFAEAQRHIDSGDQSVRAMLMNAQDPGEKVVSWFKQRQTLAEVGEDPTAYKQKLRDELLADPEFLAKAIETARAQASGKTNGRPNTSLTTPPSLNNVAGASRNNTAVGDGTDRSVFNEVTS